MPVVDPGGILFKDLLKIGVDELAFLQWNLHNKMDQIRHWVSCGGWGLVVPRTPSGDLDMTWAPIIDTTNGKIVVDVRKTYDFPGQSGVPPVPFPSCAAVDTAGQWITYLDDRADLTGTSRSDISIPNDSAWYTVKMTSEIVRREQGFIAVSTADKTWTGTGTRFTQYLAYTDDGLTVPRGTLLRIDDGDSANSNEGTYTVDQVASDTSMEMREFPNGTTESKLPFYVQGATTSGPLTDGDYRSYLRPVFTLVSGHVMEAAAGEFLLWEVKRNGSNIDWIDKRAANLYQPAHLHGHALVAAPLVEFNINADLSDDWTAQDGNLGGDGISSAQTIDGSSRLYGDIAPKTNGGLLAVVASSTPSVFCRHYFLDTAALGSPSGDWGNPNGGGTVTISTAASAPTVCQLVQADAADADHICIYVTSNKLAKRTTADQGATWSSATTICDPTAVSGSHTANHPFVRLLQNGRVLCVFEYYNGTETSIRYIYSDDRGATWNINGNAGHMWADPASGYNFGSPSFCQDDSGRIHTAYLRKKVSDGQVHVYYEISASRYTLTRYAGGDDPDASTFSAGRFFVSGSDDDECSGTAVIAEPGGSACVIYGVHRTTGTDKMFFACVQFAVAHTPTINPLYDLKVDAVGYYVMPIGCHFWNGFPDDQHLSPHVCHDRTGWHMCWFQEGGTDMIHTRLVVTAQPRNGIYIPTEPS